MKYRAVLSILVAALTVPVLTVRAQSLADVSKKEEERRKTIKAPSKVYTNDDLKSAPAPTPTPAADADAAASTAAADPGAPATAEKSGSSEAGADKPDAAATPTGPAAGGKDQASWATRGKDLRAQLDRDKTFAEALQSRINALNTDFENRSDPAQRSVVEQDRNKALADLERVKQAIKNDEKAISDFEEEARRAGVPPGWLR